MVMRIAAIYCVWDGLEILPYSIKNIAPLVGHVFVIASESSNYGERRQGAVYSDVPNMTILKWEPNLSATPMENETAKRNFGLDYIRGKGYTHFIFVDADEFYESEAFKKEKLRFENPNIAGIVCRSKVYFRSPGLTIGYDTTLVPFIHTLTNTIRCQMNMQYPFAWTDTDQVPFTPKRRIRIDPTRQMNIASGVEWSDIIMHHYSYVRNDINGKVRNSTARRNIEGSTLVADYCNAKEGYFCEFYKTRLVACENLFNIPDIQDDVLLSSSIKTTEPS